MSAIGSGYDLSPSTYSPEGRVFQIEYAEKAIDNSGTVIGLRCRDGILLAVEQPVQSKLLLAGSNRRIFSVDRHIGMAFAGVYADGKHIVARAREEAESYRDLYKVPIPANMIADRVGQYENAYTLYSSVRPFGVGVILAVYDTEKDTPHLYMVDNSGDFLGYTGIAIGKGRQVAKTEIEKLKLEELSMREALVEAAKVIQVAHDDTKDRDYLLEMSWVGKETGGVHQLVPKELLDEARKAAKMALEGDEEMVDEEA